MLMPKRIKYRKQHRGRRKGQASRGNQVSFGEFGLQALDPAWITNRQIEAARIALTRHIKRGGKVWIRIFPDKPITKKPAETRMGKGKGNPEGWVAVVKPGRVTPVIQVSCPIEHHSVHALLARQLGELLSRLLGAVNLGSLRVDALRAQPQQRGTIRIIDDLSTDILQAPCHDQPWPLRGARQTAPNAPMASPSPNPSLLSCGLAHFEYPSSA